MSVPGCVHHSALSGSQISFLVSLTPQMAAYSTSTAMVRLEVIEAGGKVKAPVRSKQKSRKNKDKPC